MASAELLVDRVIRLERVVRAGRMNESEYMREVTKEDIAEWLGEFADGISLLVPKPPVPVTHAGVLKVKGEEKDGMRGGDATICGGEVNPPAHPKTGPHIMELIDWLDRRLGAIEAKIGVVGEPKPQ
jgi:hypothetical protein